MVSGELDNRWAQGSLLPNRHLSRAQPRLMSTQRRSHHGLSGEVFSKIELQRMTVVVGDRTTSGPYSDAVRSRSYRPEMRQPKCSGRCRLRTIASVLSSR